jgi:type IV pilus assembly protein PilM
VIIPQEIAMTNIMRNALEEGRTLEDKEYCIVNLGHRTTQVFVFKGEKLVVLRNIHIGSGIIDKAIAENENVDEFVARTYKNTNYNNVLDKQYVNDEYGRIALEVRKVINFYRFNNRDSEIEDIYFAGGGSNLKGLSEMIAESNELVHKNMMELLPPAVDEGIDFSGICAIGVMLQ